MVTEVVRIRCPYCAKTFRATNKFIGQKWSCRHCTRPFVAQAISNQTWLCDACGNAEDEPTQRVEYMRLLAIAVLFHIKYIRGNLCRDCRKEYFWDYTLLTLTFGWLGFPSCLLTPFCALGNVYYHLRAARAMPVPPVVGQVRLPAHGLILTSLAHSAVALVMILGGLSNAGDLGGVSLWQALKFGVAAFGLLVAPLAVVAARRMRALRSLTLARVAAISVMLVPSPALLVAVPCGLWALVVLRRPAVVEVFR